MIWSARQDSNPRVTALEVPCLIHLGHWRNLVEPVGLEPTLGFLPLIKSQVSASIRVRLQSWWVTGKSNPVRAVKSRLCCRQHL